MHLHVFVPDLIFKSISVMAVVQLKVKCFDLLFFSVSGPSSASQVTLDGIL